MEVRKNDKNYAPMQQITSHILCIVFVCIVYYTQRTWKHFIWCDIFDDTTFLAKTILILPEKLHWVNGSGDATATLNDLDSAVKVAFYMLVVI